MCAENFYVPIGISNEFLWRRKEKYRPMGPENMPAINMIML
jgi:hypothetical protein